MPEAGRVRILGIDPGSLKAGWGAIDVEERARRLHHVDNGVISLDEGAPLPERMVQLSRRLREVVESLRPDVAAVEDVFVNRGVRSALILGQARGAVLATVGLCGVRVASHSASRVKMRVTGHGRATKEQVQEMVTRLLDLGAHPFEDAADALAVALCHSFEGFAEAAISPGSLAAAPAAQARGHKGKRAGLAALARAQGKL